MLSASVRAASARSSLPSAARRLPSRSRAAPARRAMASSAVPEGLSDGCKGAPAAPGAKLPLMAPESVMSAKAHGTSERPVQDTLRYGCDPKLADRICCFNRHYAEHAGYFVTTNWLKEVDRNVETTYYDSVTGLPLFIAPRGRTFAAFEAESRSHGWPSFRDAEVVWENVRTLEDGECVSLNGTHLGHNLPDRTGNRYCINLVSCAGSPK